MNKNNHLLLMIINFKIKKSNKMNISKINLVFLKLKNYNKKFFS